MQDTKDQVIITIIAAVAVLLFIGILFLVMIWAYNNKRQQMERDKQKIQDDFDKQLLQSKLEIQEDTFNLISQEIHDNVGQMLSLAKVQLHIISEQQAGIQGLEDVKDTIGAALADLRNIAKSLSSERIYSLSLKGSISEEMERLSRSGLKIFFHQEGDEKEISKQVKLILFRIIQEALQNTLKHAKATTVDISFRYLPERVEIQISDNGTGFRVDEQLRRLNGLGLPNILSRSALIGGVAAIHSKAGEGTTISINIAYA